MKISFIIPFYNREDTILRCLRSVTNKFKINNTYEIILIDDNSSDNTYEIAKKFLDKKKVNFQYFKNFKNLGSNRSRNIGYTNATGDWCVFLDSDDEICIEQEILEEYFDRFSKNNLISLRCIDCNKKIIGKIDKNEFNSYSHKFYLNNFYNFPEVLDCVQKKIIGNKKIFNEGFFLGCEFVTWSDMISEYGDKILINKPGRIYNLDASNQISNIPKVDRSNDFVKAYLFFLIKNFNLLKISTIIHVSLRIVYYQFFSKLSLKF